MTKRHRLEDLGELKVKLELLGDSPLFDLYQGRAKDVNEWFVEQSEDERYHFLEQMIYAIEAMNSDVAECVLIARGHHDSE